MAKSRKPSLRITAPAAALVIAVALAAVYGRGLDFPFVFDTKGTLNRGLSALSNSAFPFAHRWFTILTFKLTYLFFGLRPFWYKLGNLAVHVATVILLFHLARALLAWVRGPAPKDAPRDSATALFAALLFGLNPAAVYAVIYDVQRGTLLATFFALSALLVSLRRATREDAPFWPALPLYFLAVHSREHAIFLPALCLILRWVCGEPPIQALKRDFLIWIGILAIAAAVPFEVSENLLFSTYEPQILIMRRSAEAVQWKALTGLTQLAERPSPLLNLVNQSGLFFRYLESWIFPAPSLLAIDIPTPFPQRLLSWPQAAGVPLFAGYGAAAFGFLMRPKRGIRLLGFALFVPWALFLVEFTTIRVHEAFVLYRSYLWMPTLMIAVAAIADRALGRLAPFLLAAACLGFFTLAVTRVATFRSDEAVWRDAAEKIDTGDAALFGTSAYRPFSNWGSALAERQAYDAATEKYLVALKLNPVHSLTQQGLGMIAAAQGRNHDAEREFIKSIELDSMNVNAMNSLAKVKAKLGDISAARNYYERVAGLDPNNDQARYGLGVILELQGHQGEAEAAYRQAIAIEPGNAFARFNLGTLLARGGRMSEAEECFREVIRQQPDYLDAYHRLGLVLYAEDKKDEARLVLKMALAKDPLLPPVEELLEKIQTETGRP